MSAEMLFSCGLGILPALYLWQARRLAPSPQECICIIGMLPVNSFGFGLPQAVRGKPEHHPEALTTPLVAVDV